MKSALLFTTSRCKGCQPARDFLEELGINFREYKRGENGYFPICELYDINSWPTLVLVYNDKGGYEKVEGFAKRKMSREIKKWEEET